MFKWFKKKETKKAVKVEKLDRMVLRATVFNKALAYPIATYEFKESEKDTAFGLYTQYPSNKYNIIFTKY